MYLPDWYESHDVNRDQGPVGVSFRTLVVGDDLVMLRAERDQVLGPIEIPAPLRRVRPVMNLKPFVDHIERA